MSIQIDAHGETHKLRIVVNRGEVTIYLWDKLCDPDEPGSYSSNIRHGAMTLADCLELARDRGPHKSQRARIIDGATSYLARRRVSRQ